MRSLVYWDVLFTTQTHSKFYIKKGEKKIEVELDKPTAVCVRVQISIIMIMF